MGVLKVWDEDSQQFVVVSGGGGVTGSFPDATGQPATKIAQTDGADGWPFIDTPSGGGGDYLPLTGGTLTGDLTLPSMTGVVAAAAPDPTTVGTRGAITDYTFSYPAGIQTGDVLVLSSIRTSSTATEHPLADPASTGFSAFPGYSGTAPVIGSVSGTRSGMCLYYKVADGTEGGTQVTFTYNNATERTVRLFVVRGVADPATVNPIIANSPAENDLSAGVVTFGAPGLMFALGGGQDTKVQSGNPATAGWGTELYSIGYTTGLQNYLNYYDSVPAGDNPLVDFVYANGDLYAGCAGLLFFPQDVSAERLSVNSTITMNNNRIVNLGTPVDAADAATKAYVDANGGGGGGSSITYSATPPTSPADGDIWIERTV